MDYLCTILDITAIGEVVLDYNSLGIAIAWHKARRGDKDLFVVTGYIPTTGFLFVVIFGFSLVFSGGELHARIDGYSRSLCT